MVDPSLLAKIQHGDKAAFKELYQACIAYVYSIVKRYVSNSSDYPDVIQEIFARVFLSINTYDKSKGDFKFWLRRLVINQCMQHYRRGRSPAVVVPISSLSESETANDLEKRLTKLSKAEIESLLGGMPIGYRQVFMLVAIEEYSHVEVGELMDISPETSRSQFFRAKSWLRKNMSDNKLKTLANGL